MSLLHDSLLDNQQFTVTDVMILFRSGESVAEMHMDVIFIMPCRSIKSSVPFTFLSDSKKVFLLSSLEIKLSKKKIFAVEQKRVPVLDGNTI